MYLEPSEGGGGLQCVLDYDVPNGTTYGAALNSIVNSMPDSALWASNIAILKFVNDSVETSSYSYKIFCSRFFYNYTSFDTYNRPTWYFSSPVYGRYFEIQILEGDCRIINLSTSGGTSDNYTGYTVPDGSKIQIWVG